MQAHNQKFGGNSIPPPFLTLYILSAIFLFIPGYYAFSRTGDEVNLITLSLSSCALAGIVMIPACWLEKRFKFIGVGWFTSQLLLLLVVRLSHALLVDFTGKGFNDEVFFHIEPQSFLVGWQEYGSLLIIVTGFTLPIFILAGMLLKRTAHRHMGGKVWLLAIACVGLLGVNRSASSEYLLLTAYESYAERSLPFPAGNNTSLDQFIALGIVQPVVTPKSSIVVNIPDRPRNLILLYLESFNLGLIDHPRYPDLTPNLNRLKNKYGSVENFFSSAYITIEGIISSQCGTLVDMSNKSDLFMGNESRMKELPCMGDMLKQAGYRQIYLGGAELEFGKKGKFLTDHGYDDIRGWEYWREHGFPLSTGKWGLSDTLLFEQALTTLHELQKTPPYNLTLLTLGTHVPGFSYEGCSPYDSRGHNDQFLDAIHCTDTLVGSFVDRLSSEGYLNNDTVLVITADHGVFPTPKMRELFGDMVNDRRLVTIVAGGKLPWDVPMASYDLAPSILDLLGVQHNSSFIFGTSASANNHHRDFFATHYGDYMKGKFIDNSPSKCTTVDPNFTPALPLTPCGKRLLLSSVSQYQRWFSSK